jgi:hypothetical protein
MPSRLAALSFDANDPARLHEFWTGLLGPDTGGLTLRFLPTDQPKLGPNQIHFDLASNVSSQADTVARALELGARHLDVGQRPEEGHVVLADPEGNEFCVIEEGNRFLAGQGIIGALSSDGTREVGYFWAAALDRPLIWDQNEETAIRADAGAGAGGAGGGGPIVSWGGPPLAERKGRSRLRLELSAGGSGNVPTEVDRLIALGATYLDLTDDGVLLADPDGNEFHVRP